MGVWVWSQLPAQSVRVWGFLCRQLTWSLSSDWIMELLEHRSSSDVGSSHMHSIFEKSVSDCPSIGNTGSCGSQEKMGGLKLDMAPEGSQVEVMEEGEAGPLEVFQPGDAAVDQDPSIVVAEALRCQVKITTRRSLHLRIANHTARDVYVRLVGHGGRIAGASSGHQKYTLEQSKMQKTWRKTLPYREV